METTVGQLLLNNLLPEDMRDYDRTLDKKAVQKIFAELADRYPDKYAEISQKFHTLATQTTARGGKESSFALDSFRAPAEVVGLRDVLRSKVDAILASSASEDKKDEAIIEAVSGAADAIGKANFDAGMKNNNPLALQVASGSRGSHMQFRSLTAGDMMTVDHKNNPIPIPMLSSYAEGLDPVQYWAGSYGARKGLAEVKFATPKGGFLGKQLALATHRLVIAEPDCGTKNGISVPADDSDNSGALLSSDMDSFKRGTILTPEILREMKGDIMVRSPMTCESNHGICQRCAGIRERGGFSPIGDAIGIAAAGAVAEPISQGMLCLAEGTLVRMGDWSVKPIELVEPGDRVMGSDRNGNLSAVSVLRRFDNGAKECIETHFRVSTTEEDVCLISTGEHKLLGVARRWDPLTEIADKGIWPVNERCVRLCGLMPRTVQYERGESEPFALLLGLLLGDGCYTASVRNVNLSCYDPSLIEETAGYMRRLGLRFSNASGHVGYYQVVQLQDSVNQDSVTGRLLPGARNPALKKLQNYRMHEKYAHEKRIPDEVWNWDQASVLALLSGLIATDGSVYAEKEELRPRITYSSTSLPLIQSIRELFRVRFAIQTNPIKSVSMKKKKWSKHQLYVASISRWQDVKRCAELLTIPGRKGKRLAELLASAREVTKDTRYFYRRASRPVGICFTHDIEVDHPDHLFVLANGLIISNSSKHVGGVVGGSSGKSGLDLITQLVQVPKTFQGGAAISQTDGKVEKIVPAPQGGYYIQVNKQNHWMAGDQEAKVKQGDEVEAGDVLSTGVPNPALIVQHKGIGEGRRYFMNQLRDTMNENGFGVNRRNLELISRGLINHVRVTEPYGPRDTIMDDLVEYDYITRDWQPRVGAQMTAPAVARGKYLEKPVLSYTVGTRVTPRIAKALQAGKIGEVLVHNDPPPFVPEMTRAMETLSGSEDWMVQLGGFHLKKNFLEGVHRGKGSDPHGTSFIPALAMGTEFGKDRDKGIF